MLTVLPHQVLSLKRFAPITTTASGSIPGAVMLGQTTGSLSAASPQDIARLEEGKRTRQAYKFITADQLNVAAQGGQVPDWIQIDSFWFEVSTMTPYQNGIMTHFEYILTKIENPQDYTP